MKKKIVLTSPTMLVATMKVVRLLWQKENQVRNVNEISVLDENEQEKKELGNGDITPDELEKD